MKDWVFVMWSRKLCHLHYRQPILDLQPDLDSVCMVVGCVLVFSSVVME